MLQPSVSSVFEQGRPLCIGCCVTFLLLVVIPPLHVFEHLLQSLHPPIKQSTGPDILISCSRSSYWETLPKKWICSNPEISFFLTPLQRDYALQLVHSTMSTFILIYELCTFPWGLVRNTFCSRTSVFIHVFVSEKRFP